MLLHETYKFSRIKNRIVLGSCNINQLKVTLVSEMNNGVWTPRGEVFRGQP